MAELTLTEGVVAALPVPEKGNRVHYLQGATVRGGSAAPRGFAVKVTSTGVRTYVLRYAINGVDRLATIGRVGDWSALNAVKEARRLRQLVDRGEDPLGERHKQRQAQAEEKAQADTSSVAAVCESWFKREGHKLRTGDYRRHELSRLVYPRIGKTNVLTLTRAAIVNMLDDIEDKHGASMAGHTLAYLSAVLNWHEGRVDGWRSPIVRGMRRPLSQERERVLGDDELRAVWQATAAGTPFDRYVRFVLLTACRRSEASGLVRSEISRQPVSPLADRWQTLWTLPAARNKPGVELVRPLSDQALAALGEISEGCYAFTNRPEPLTTSLSTLRGRLQKKSQTNNWTLHDLRRTSRTLMSRAGVPSDHAERCLGHVVGGIRGIYDRHRYVAEMAEAYAKLAALIERIVNPSAVDNVVRIGAAG